MHTHTHLVYSSQTVDSRRLQMEGSLPRPPDMPCPGGKAYAEDVSSLTQEESPEIEGMMEKGGNWEQGVRGRGEEDKVEKNREEGVDQRKRSGRVGRRGRGEGEVEEREGEVEGRRRESGGGGGGRGGAVEGRCRKRWRGIERGKGRRQKMACCAPFHHNRIHTSPIPSLLPSLLPPPDTFPLYHAVYTEEKCSDSEPQCHTLPRRRKVFNRPGTGDIVHRTEHV